MAKISSDIEVLAPMVRVAFAAHDSEVFDQINEFEAGTPTNVINPKVLTHRRRL